MAVLSNMPSEHIITALKGVIDFYWWKGLPVARKWPDEITKSDEWKATAENAKETAALWRKMKTVDRDAYARMTSQVFATCYDAFRRTAQTMKDPKQVMSLESISESQGCLEIHFEIIKGRKQALKYKEANQGDAYAYPEIFQKRMNEESWKYMKDVGGYFVGAKEVQGVETQTGASYSIELGSKNLVKFYLGNEFIPYRFSSGIYCWDREKQNLRSWKYEFSEI